MENWNDDLTHNTNSGRDIVEVLRWCIGDRFSLLYRFFQQNYERLFTYSIPISKEGGFHWKRKEVEEMTLEEVCKALGKEIKIIKK